MPLGLCCLKSNTNVNSININNKSNNTELVKLNNENNKNISNIVESKIEKDKVKKKQGEGDRIVALRKRFRTIVSDINDGAWKPGPCQDLGRIQKNLQELVRRYDKAMKECERVIPEVYTRSKDITPEIRKDIVAVQDQTFQPLMEDMARKGLQYLQKTLEPVSKRGEGWVQNPLYQFSKGFLTSTGFGSKQFAYLLASMTMQNIGGLTSSTTFGIRSDQFWARICDSAFIGPVHFWGAAFATQATSKLKGPEDTSVTRPLPQGDHNFSMSLAQRVLGFDLPLAACFWVCYHVKGLVDDFSGNVNPLTLALTGAAASMTAGGMTALLSELSYKTMALRQMQSLQRSVSDGNQVDKVEQEFLDFLKGAHHANLTMDKKPDDGSPFYMFTKVISSVVGSLVMLYYLNLATMTPMQTGGPTGSPTQMPDDPTRVQPDHWSDDSPFVRTGLAMACYLIGWCLFRPIFEVALTVPSTDSKFNERIDKVKDTFKSSNDFDIESGFNQKERNSVNIIQSNFNKNQYDNEIRKRTSNQNVNTILKDNIEEKIED